MTGQGDGKQGEEGHEWGEAVPAAAGHPKPGDIIIDPSFSVAQEPLVGHDVSTPLEEDEPEHTIPPGALWAMKERRHIQWHLLPAHERHERIRECLDADNYTLYCIDDGRHHAMIGRRVGVSPNECEYTLLGRISRQRYEELRDEVVLLVNCFDTATELRLCGVAIEEDIRSSNVFDVAVYESVDDIPEDYRPGSPYHHFKQELAVTAYQ
jgi:hypothetical protein